MEAGRTPFPILTPSVTTLHSYPIPGRGPLAGERRDIGGVPDQVTISAFDATTMASVGANISYSAPGSGGIYGAAADLVNGFGYFIPYTSGPLTKVLRLTSVDKACSTSLACLFESQNLFNPSIHLHTLCRPHQRAPQSTSMKRFTG